MVHIWGVVIETHLVARWAKVIGTESHSMASARYAVPVSLPPL